MTGFNAHPSATTYDSLMPKESLRKRKGTSSSPEKHTSRG
ncbi:hypothetical protein PFLA_a1577 [Pseudoalteromonas flavipulchra NCIMB 2033 = ATCC BAA-314]|nr:hypothetical protein [Pseudoalteromonas flavipulchra NCIMB 2033 = ATCC BAA-314]